MALPTTSKIKNGVPFNPRPDLAVNQLEAVWIEILFPRTKGILVCARYRPPMDGEFLSKFEQSLAKVETGKELFILGDFNINLGQQSSSLASKYLDILGLFNCTLLITESARLTLSGGTILDHIIVNKKGKVRESGVIDSGLSNHLVTYCSRGFCGNASGGSLIKNVRSFENYSAESGVRMV